MHCRRCRSRRLVKLDKHPQDQDVYRCRECGFLFSPAPDPGEGLPVSHSQPEAPQTASPVEKAEGDSDG